MSVDTPEKPDVLQDGAISVTITSDALKGREALYRAAIRYVANEGTFEEEQPFTFTGAVSTSSAPVGEYSVYFPIVSLAQAIVEKGDNDLTVISLECWVGLRPSGLDRHIPRLGTLEVNFETGVATFDTLVKK